MRLIFVDTETTGLSPRDGHRIVEIACVEMIEGQLTGREFHHLVNPQRPVPPVAVEIHGIDDAMLQCKPTFAEMSAQLIDFVADGKAVMHHAPFDTAFFADEFKRIGAEFSPLVRREEIIDTLPLFRARYPGARCSLEALCSRHGLAPAASEGWHGALTDARMLARLWLAAGMRGSTGADPLL